MISNLVTDNNNEEEEEVTPPGTPNEDEAETLKTPEKCDDILFEVFILRSSHTDLYKSYQI